MRQLALYFFFGGLGASFDFAMFYISKSAGAGYQLANLAGYGFGTLVSFSLNNAFTFNAKDKTFARLLGFFAVAAIGYSISAAMLWFLVESLLMSSNLAKAFTIPVVATLQFTLNKLITFRTVT